MEEKMWNNVGVDTSHIACEILLKVCFEFGVFTMMFSYLDRIEVSEFSI